MKNNITTILIPTCILCIAVLLLNPFDFWMPDMVVASMLGFLFILFGLFASFVLKERAGDEREGQHRTLAGRNAFLAGSFIILLGIAFQSYIHTVDPWLVGALVVMIVVKIGTRQWSDRNL